MSGTTRNVVWRKSDTPSEVPTHSQINEGDLAFNIPDQRVFANFGGDVVEMVTGTHSYSSSDFDSDFSGKTTSDLSEGSNKYFTESRARDSISVSGDLTYNSGVISFSETYSNASQIKVAYESNADTNAFTDNDAGKLNGIESGATRDQTKSDIDALEIDARTLQGKSASDFDVSGSADAVRRETDEKLRKRPDPLLVYFL